MPNAIATATTAATAHQGVRSCFGWRAFSGWRAGQASGDGPEIQRSPSGTSTIATRTESTSVSTGVK